MAEFKKEEQAVINEMREECNKREEQAAELNFQLQERVDELVEKLNKQNAPTLRIEELDQGTGDTPRSVCNAERFCKRGGWGNAHAKHSNE
jgi:low affinity Fe/Cu permease